MRVFCRLHGMVAVVFVFFTCTCLPARAEEKSTVCRVNDPASGWWRLVMEMAPCLFPGERHPESPWVNNPSPPSPQNPDGRVYRIEGNYRMSVAMTARGFAWTPPPEGELCITGYAEAYTKDACEGYYQSLCTQFPNCRTTYTASGTLCTAHYTGPPGSDSYNYARYLEYAIRIREWVCYDQTVPQAIANLGAGDGCL